MACWSAENATKAFLRALKMRKRGKEPDTAEFISALAAGNNAQLLVMACAGTAGSTTTTALALVAAAHQTGGRVVCILPSPGVLQASKNSLGHYADRIEFATGNAKTLLVNDLKGADFVLIDCDINDHKGIFLAAKKGTAKNVGALIVGYNALHKGSWGSDHELRTDQTQFLPIGEGLLVSKSTNTGSANAATTCNYRFQDGPKRSHHWVVKVDKCTGEEHVFRISSPKRQWIEA
ncbi:hypothetical protein L484_025571 [Morus notabilis]|uniref:Uncharacterized protein n=1 Tax=Morus notabilis TaxID=981085 RepID=W9RXB3_9ROSA|nr:uncharacterized protein LOC21408261 [Morus notabilis]EXB76217.1 hypothetical protein L484_025571 [Morus notabilis]